MPINKWIDPIPSLTTKQVAQEVGVAEITLYMWRRMGIGPRYIRRGSRIYYPIEDLQRWYANGNQRIGTTVPDA